MVEGGKSWKEGQLPGTKAKDDAGKMNLASTESLSSSPLVASKKCHTFPHFAHFLGCSVSCRE